MSLGPTYGAPLGAIPQGVESFSSVREMLSEVFFDLNRAWVKEFLFKPDPQVQAAVLTTPSNLERSLAFTQRVVSDPDTVPAEHAFEKFMVGLVVPAGEKEGLGTAVMVESHSTCDGFMKRTDRVMQVVSDARAGSVLAVSVDETRNIAEVWYNKSDNFFMMASFHEHQFRKAISDAVDFDGLQKAIISSLTGTRESSGSRAPPPDNMLLMNESNLDASGILFPGRRRIAVGNWYAKNMLAFYDGVRGDVVFSTMSASVISRNFGCAYGAVEEMKRFAVCDRLGRLKVNIPVNMNVDISWDEGFEFLNELLDTATAHTQHYGSGNSNNLRHVPRAISISSSISKVQRTRIAPAPSPTRISAGQYSTKDKTELSYAQQADLEYAKKMQRKRERNRLAAKKSNDKKRAARQQRREGLG